MLSIFFRVLQSPTVLAVRTSASGVQTYVCCIGQFAIYALEFETKAKSKMKTPRFNKSYLGLTHVEVQSREHLKEIAIPFPRPFYLTFAIN